MNTQEQTTVKTNVIELLNAFVNKRPGLDFNDYGDRKIYFTEAREITKDLHDFRELARLADSLYYPNELNDILYTYLDNSGDRLSLVNGKLQYITGQYFPTEYRPAVNRLYVRAIWAYFMKLKNADGSDKYPTGGDIRTAIKKRLTSTRVKRNYFN